jgi:hypothetical protein
MNVENTVRLQQGLCCLLRRDRLQRIDERGVQARATGVSYQGAARRSRLVAARRTFRSCLHRARCSTRGGRIAATDRSPLTVT